MERAADAAEQIDHRAVARSRSRRAGRRARRSSRTCAARSRAVARAAARGRRRDRPRATPPRTRRTPRRSRAARAPAAPRGSASALGARDHRAGRVVRRAEHDELGARRDRGDQRVDVARELGGRRRGDERPAGDLRGEPVARERVLVRQHLVGRLAGREHELVQEVVRAVAERELVERDAELARRARGAARSRRRRGRGGAATAPPAAPRAPWATGPSGFSFDATLIAPVIPSSRSSSSIGLPG